MHTTSVMLGCFDCFFFLESFSFSSKTKRPPSFAKKRSPLQVSCELCIVSLIFFVWLPSGLLFSGSGGNIGYISDVYMSPKLPPTSQGSQILRHHLWYSKVVSTHPQSTPQAIPRSPIMKEIPLGSLLVKVARGVFQFGVLKQPLVDVLRRSLSWLALSRE